jgi:hypothetical protein
MQQPSMSLVFPHQNILALASPANGIGNQHHQGHRMPRRRNSIDWGNEHVQRVCAMISARQISIKKGSDMLGIDYSTLYYHLVRNSPGKFAARQQQQQLQNSNRGNLGEGALQQEAQKLVNPFFPNQHKLSSVSINSASPAS